MPDDPKDRDLRDDLDPDPYRDLDRRGDRERQRERLEDLEIEPSRGPDDSAETPPPSARRERLFPMVLVGLAVLGSVLLAAMLFLFRTPAKPRSSTAPGPVASPPASAAGASAPAAPLPPLDASDDFARSLGAALSSHPEFTRWLGRSGLVRTVAAVVTNVADGESPRPHLEFLAPAGRFRTRTGAGGRIVADPAGFQRFDALGDAAASVNASAAVSAYRAIEPLLDEAHRELGHPEGRFRDSLDRAITALLAVPVPPSDAPLVPHATLMRWADPALEALTPAQKQLLRTGPRNVRLVQDKLREIRAALAAAPSSS